MEADKNSNRRSFVTFVTGLAAWLLHQAAACADDLLATRRARHRVQPLCSLPREAYQFEARTPSLVVRSLPALEQSNAVDVDAAVKVIDAYAKSVAEIEAVPIPNATPMQLALRSELAIDRRRQAEQMLQHARRAKSKLLQLPVPQLTMAHCSLSDVALRIEPMGTWQFSARGDQNYLRDNEVHERNIDLQLKRNAFKVKIRLLDSGIVTGPAPELTSVGPQHVPQPGTISFAAIDVPEFWVQREAPQLITQRGYSPFVGAHYDDIDQAEFEFFVKLDPLTGSGKGVVQPWQREP